MRVTLACSVVDETCMCLWWRTLNGRRCFSFTRWFIIFSSRYPSPKTTTHALHAIISSSLPPDLPLHPPLSYPLSPHFTITAYISLGQPGGGSLTVSFWIEHLNNRRNGVEVSVHMAGEEYKMHACYYLYASTPSLAVFFSMAFVPVTISQTGPFHSSKRHCWWSTCCGGVPQGRSIWEGHAHLARGSTHCQGCGTCRNRQSEQEQVRWCATKANEYTYIKGSGVRPEVEPESHPCWWAHAAADHTHLAVESSVRRMYWCKLPEQSAER